MGQIQLNNSTEVVLVDDLDLPKLAGLRWLSSWHRSRKYAVAYKNRRVILMHRLILGVTDHTIQVDHINGDGFDNRRANLRPVTHAQQMQNRRVHKNCKSGVRGVYWDIGDRKWRAQVQLNGKRVFDKRFHSLAAAATAAREMRLRFMSHTVEAE